MYIKINRKNNNWTNFLASCKEFGYKVWDNIYLLTDGEYIFINKDVQPFTPVGTGKWIILYSRTNTEFGNNYLDLDRDYEKISSIYF